jgi:hypothetical protein
MSVLVANNVQMCDLANSHLLRMLPSSKPSAGTVEAKDRSINTAKTCLAMVEATCPAIGESEMSKKVAGLTESLNQFYSLLTETEKSQGKDATISKGNADLGFW